MKKERKEKLHEDDRFIKFVDRAWRGMAVLGKRFRLGLVLAVAALLIVLVVLGAREEAADAALSAADTARTIGEMEAAAKEHPGNPDLLHRLGLAYAARGGAENLARAESALRKALAARGRGWRRALTRFALGKVLMERGKYEEALKHFEAAARDRQARVLIGHAAVFHAGRCLEQLGRPDEAAAKYQIIAPDPEDIRQRRDLWQELAAERQVHLRRDVFE